eukprot:RCo018315
MARSTMGPSSGSGFGGLSSSSLAPGAMEAAETFFNELSLEMQHPALPLYYDELEELKRELADMNSAAARILVERLHGYSVQQSHLHPDAWLSDEEEGSGNETPRGGDSEFGSTGWSPTVVPREGALGSTSAGSFSLASSMRDPTVTGRSAVLAAFEQKLAEAKAAKRAGKGRAK